MIITPYDPLTMDLVDIYEVYQKAFCGFPWFEVLAEEEVERRWKKHCSKRGFFCEVALAESQKVVGMSYFYTPGQDELSQERGENVARFLCHHAGPDVQLVWYCETCVLPEFQGRGIASELKKSTLQFIKNSYQCSLILTRMRDDNTNIICLNSSLGFQRTGIRVPSSQKPDVFHEYWYLRLEEK